MNCMAFEFRGPAHDRDIYECVKPWQHEGEHEFIKVEEVTVRNTRFEPDVIAAFQKEINDQDPSCQYSTNAVRAALFTFVERRIDALIEDLAWHWDHEHGWDCLGEPDMEPVEQPDEEAETQAQVAQP